MKEIPAKSIDLIICDLPYGCLNGGAGKEKEKRSKLKTDQIMGCTWDIKIDLDQFWKEIRRIRKNDHTPTIHFCTTKFGIDLITSNPKEFRYDLVWNKDHGVSFLQANKMPMRSHEMIYVFSKTGAYYDRIDETGDFKHWKRIRNKKDNGGCYGGPARIDTVGGDGTRCALSVINIKKVGGCKGIHPTEKPINLYRWLIDRYCPPGGTVLDPTFGSGNSVFTAYASGRNAIGIEKDDHFFEKAVERLNAL